MNFSYGVIAAMGVLIAISLGLIAADPGHVIGPYLADVPADAPSMPAFVSLPQGTASPGCESTNECFIPYEVSVGVGDTVTWSNDDVVSHTVTSGLLPHGHDGIFDSGLFMAGTAFEFTFEEAGHYDYFCLVHPWMAGKVIVA